jgi:hypothetical protein
LFAVNICQTWAAAAIAEVTDVGQDARDVGITAELTPRTCARAKRRRFPGARLGWRDPRQHPRPKSIKPNLLFLLRYERPLADRDSQCRFKMSIQDVEAD